MIGLAAGACGVAVLAFSVRYTWWRPLRPGVPVLMYHQVGPHRPGSRLNRWRVRPSDLERQLDLLVRLGRVGVPLRDLLREPPRPAGDPRVALTFDDGFDGVRVHALPLLAARGFHATVFVVSGRLGGANDWDGESPPEPLLGADGVRELAAAGWEIGSHGASHRALTPLADRELADETAGSRAALEEATGAPVVSFCYPYGAFDTRSVEAVRGAGYELATVIRGGLVASLSDPLRLKRVGVRGTNDLLDFRLALRRGRSRL